MAAWDAYKTAAAARGALALELFAAHSTPAADDAAVQAALPDHLAYQRELETEGKLVLAGPLSDPSGARIEGAGLIVYRAASFEEARALAEADPMHRLGARQFDLRRWLINEGGLTLSVGLSTKTVGLA